VLPVIQEVARFDNMPLSASFEEESENVVGHMRWMELAVAPLMKTTMSKMSNRRLLPPPRSMLLRQDLGF
jgi:hypothetical protein